MWIQLLGSKQIDIDGKARAYHRGDWVDVGKQTALGWVTDGSARVTVPITVDLPDGSGIVVNRIDDDASGLLARFGLGKVAITVSPVPLLPYERTVLWRSGSKVRGDLFAAGLTFLDRWSLAIPLWGYDELARDVGTAEDRERTLALVHDLRVPLYNPCLVFARRNAEAEQVLAAWQIERQGGDERLALLRAIYQVKPLLLALPPTWAGR